MILAGFSAFDSAPGAVPDGFKEFESGWIFRKLRKRPKI